MLVAVIHGGECYYLGQNEETALSIFRSKSGLPVKMIYVENLSDIQEALDESNTKTSSLDESISDTLHRLLNTLENSGLNEKTSEQIREQLQNGSEKLVADVKSLGIRGMHTVSEGLTALGDLVCKVSEKEIESQSAEDELNDPYK